jgi:hypothetical protein
VLRTNSVSCGPGRHRGAALQLRERRVDHNTQFAGCRAAEKSAHLAGANRDRLRGRIALRCGGGGGGGDQASDPGLCVEGELLPKM